MSAPVGRNGKSEGSFKGGDQSVMWESGERSVVRGSGSQPNRTKHCCTHYRWMGAVLMMFKAAIYKDRKQAESSSYCRKQEKIRFSAAELLQSEHRC